MARRHRGLHRALHNTAPSDSAGAFVGPASFAVVVVTIDAADCLRPSPRYVATCFGTHRLMIEIEGQKPLVDCGPLRQRSSPLRERSRTAERPPRNGHGEASVRDARAVRAPAIRRTAGPPACSGARTRRARCPKRRTPTTERCASRVGRDVEDLASPTDDRRRVPGKVFARRSAGGRQPSQLRASAPMHGRAGLRALGRAICCHASAAGVRQDPVSSNSVLGRRHPCTHRSRLGSAPSPDCDSPVRHTYLRGRRVNAVRVSSRFRRCSAPGARARSPFASR